MSDEAKPTSGQKLPPGEFEDQKIRATMFLMEQLIADRNVEGLINLASRAMENKRKLLLRAAALNVPSVGIIDDAKRWNTVLAKLSDALTALKDVTPKDVTDARFGSFGTFADVVRDRAKALDQRVVRSDAQGKKKSVQKPTGGETKKF